MSHPRTFELAKIIKGCDLARSAEDLQALETAAQGLPDAEKAEALGTIGHRREELTKAQPGRKGSADELFE